MVHEVAALTTAGFLNGMSTLSASDGLIILSDSVYCAIWLVDTKTGNYSEVLTEKEIAPPNSQSLGINGVRALPHSHDTAYIYFDNTGNQTFYRVPFSISTLQKVGEVELLAEGFAIDDFALDGESGFAYLASPGVNSLLKVELSGGEAETLYGGLNETVLPGPTSVVVGRG